MPSKIINTLIPNDQAFAANFNMVSYQPEISQPILNIWSDLKVKIKQEEKSNTYLYVYHEAKIIDTLESISLQYYDTTSYWWLILVINDTLEPFDFLREKIDDDTPIKIIKPQFLSSIVTDNKTNDLSKYLGMSDVE